MTAHRGDEESFRHSPLYRSLGEQEPLFARLNNTDGLSKVYNRYLEGHFEDFTSFGTLPDEHTKDDIVAFVHDDVEIVGDNAIAELNRWASEGYAILGLAGGSRAILKPPALWHYMTQNGEHSGCSVYHIAMPDPTTGEVHPDRDQPFMISFGPFHDVVMLDGLFMAVVLSAVTPVGWRFDERFKFHHYDVSACLRAHACGLKMRTVFLPVVHWSVQAVRADDRNFLESERAFLEAYAPNGPIAVWC